MRDTKINRCNWLIRNAKETFATRFARSRWIVSIESKKCFTSELRKLISVGSTLYSLQLYRMAFRIRISRNQYKYGKYIYIQIAIYIYIGVKETNIYICLSYVVNGMTKRREKRKEGRGKRERKKKEDKAKYTRIRYFVLWLKNYSNESVFVSFLHTYMYIIDMYMYTRESTDNGSRRKNPNEADQPCDRELIDSGSLGSCFFTPAKNKRRNQEEFPRNRLSRIV